MISLKKQQNDKKAEIVSDMNLSSTGLLEQDQKYIAHIKNKKNLDENDLEIIRNGYKSSAQLQIMMNSLGKKKTVFNLKEIKKFFKYIKDMIAASNVELKFKVSRYGIDLQNYLLVKFPVVTLIDKFLLIDFFEIYRGNEDVLLEHSNDILEELQIIVPSEEVYTSLFNQFILSHYNKLPQIFIESLVNKARLERFTNALIQIKNKFENIISVLSEKEIFEEVIKENIPMQDVIKDEALQNQEPLESSDDITSMQLPAGTICTIC
ncbi:MAG: hypothetical protein ACXWL2_04295 [Candidatus Chromulinivorax sp.]